MELFKRIVADFAKSGGQYIALTDTIGDPLLDKKLIERGKYVRQFLQFKSLGFVSTLQWLHKHDMDQFIRTFTWIGVSITLSGRESYKAFFGVNKYDRALSNLRGLLTKIQAENSDFHVGISLKPTDESDDAILSHPDFKDINTMIGGGLEEQVTNRAGYLRKRPLYPRFFRPCSMLYGNMMVYSNGKVSACSCKQRAYFGRFERIEHIGFVTRRQIA